MSTEKNNIHEKQRQQTENLKDTADKKQELLNLLLEKGKADKNQLTYTAIADVLDTVDFDKNQGMNTSESQTELVRDQSSHWGWGWFRDKI